MNQWDETKTIHNLIFSFLSMIIISIALKIIVDFGNNYFKPK